MGLITLLQMNEYCQLKIEYLWNAVDLKKTEHSDSLDVQRWMFDVQLSIWCPKPLT